MPTKIYRIKMNDFWINVSYSPPHYPHQKTKKSKLPKIRKMPSKLNKSNFKNHRNCSLSTAQTFGHFISYSFKFNNGKTTLYSKPIVNMITYPDIEFE